jgi:hypothetical protein
MSLIQFNEDWGKPTNQVERNSVHMYAVSRKHLRMKAAGMRFPATHNDDKGLTSDASQGKSPVENHWLLKSLTGNHPHLSLLCL